MSAVESEPVGPVDGSVVAPEPAPPPGEEIHLPGGSIIPLVVAVGIWIRDVRRDVDELPEDHHH